MPWVETPNGEVILVPEGHQHVNRAKKKEYITETVLQDGKPRVIKKYWKLAKDPGRAWAVNPGGRIVCLPVDHPMVGIWPKADEPEDHPYGKLPEGESPPPEPPKGKGKG